MHNVRSQFSDRNFQQYVPNVFCLSEMFCQMNRRGYGIQTDLVNATWRLGIIPFLLDDFISAFPEGETWFVFVFKRFHLCISKKRNFICIWICLCIPRKRKFICVCIWFCLLNDLIFPRKRNFYCMLEGAKGNWRMARAGRRGGRKVSSQNWNWKKPFSAIMKGTKFSIETETENNI